MENKLPKNWVEAELKEIISYVIGGDWGKDPESISDDDFVEVLCIRGSEIKNWNENKGNTASLRKIKKSSLENRKLKVGDILVEISGGGPDQPVGRTVLIDENVFEFEPEISKVCTNFLRLIRVYDNLNSVFINHYFHYFYDIGEIVKYQGGSNNLRNLKFKEFETIKIPLPPLAEQNRIVTKLDALFAQHEAIKTSMAKVPELLKNFRQQVLTQAVTGKLTEELRYSNILKEIIEDKTSWYNSQLAYSLKNKSKRPRRQVTEFSGDKDYLKKFLVKKIDIAFFDEISAKKENALKAGPFGSTLKKEFYVEKGYKIYGQEQVINDNPFYGNYYVNDKKFKELQSCEVEENDLLISLVGTIGKVLIIPKGFERGIINPRLVKLSLHEKVNPRFIKIFLQSSIVKDFLKENSHGGTMDVLNLGIIKSLPIPLPSVEEQREIVSRVESLFAKAHAIELQYQSLKSKIDNLPQAILHKAFKGELSEQFDSDGDAKVLLKQIQELKNSAEKPKKVVTKKTKNYSEGDGFLGMVAEK